MSSMFLSSAFAMWSNSRSKELQGKGWWLQSWHIYTQAPQKQHIAKLCHSNGKYFLWCFQGFWWKKYGKNMLSTPLYYPHRRYSNLSMKYGQFTCTHLYTSAFIHISSAYTPYRYTQVDIRQLLGICAYWVQTLHSTKSFCITIHTYVFPWENLREYLTVFTYMWQSLQKRTLLTISKKLTYAVAHVPTQCFFVMAKFISLSEGEQTQ